MYIVRYVYNKSGVSRFAGNALVGGIINIRGNELNISFQLFASVFSVEIIRTVFPVA